MATRMNATHAVALLAFALVILPQIESGLRPPISHFRSKLSKLLDPRHAPVPVYGSGRKMRSRSSSASSSATDGKAAAAAALSDESYDYVSYPSPSRYNGGDGGGGTIGYMGDSGQNSGYGYGGGYGGGYGRGYDGGYGGGYVSRSQIPRTNSYDSYLNNYSGGSYKPEHTKSSFRKTADNHEKHVSGRESDKNYQESSAFAKTLDESDNEHYNRHDAKVVSKPNVYKSKVSTETWTKNSSKNTSKTGSHAKNKSRQTSGFNFDEKDFHENVEHRKNRNGKVSHSNSEQNIYNHDQNFYDSAGVHHGQHGSYGGVRDHGEFGGHEEFRDYHEGGAAPHYIPPSYSPEYFNGGRAYYSPPPVEHHHQDGKAAVAASAAAASGGVASSSAATS